MLNVLNKHNTLFNFYHSTKHLISPKNDFNYIFRGKKEYNLYNTILYNKDKKNNIKTNNKNRLTFNSTNKHLNYLNTKEVKSRTNKITNITSLNFWKDNNNNIDKFNYNTYNVKIIKNDNKDISSPEEKFKINSKLFELFINDYEKRIKKSLGEMGASQIDIKNKNKNNMNENEKNSNNDYDIYEKNFFNLPFLNNNDEVNNNNELDNKNNENDRNNCFNSMNENNNEIYQKEPNNNIIQSAIKEKLIKANSFKRNQINEELKDLNKKIRTFSSSPYTISYPFSE
jgi:hypothetical protein